jgi:heme/copper-type cytochrome/quinol oxidase subunit 2
MLVLAILVVVVAGIMALALWPYLGRRRDSGAASMPADDRAERSRRLVIIVLAAVVLGATVLGIRSMTERALDDREAGLRTELVAAGPARLEELRSLSLRRETNGVELAVVFGEITSSARLRGWTTSARQDDEASVEVEVGWFASTRCFRVLIEAGGEHLVVPDDC